MDFSAFKFHPVLALPAGCEVFDFTRGYDPAWALGSPYGIGRYNEKRVGMYTTELFTRERRDIHLGVDLAGPVGAEVWAFAPGTVWRVGYNGAPGDYGHTVVTRHALGERVLYALHGHLSARSGALRAEGEAFEAGAVLGWLGDRHENGGWNPHLHFQLSWEAPATADMPGVVNDEGRAAALLRHPDPRLVLGPIY
ncbi:MAG: peptidoglycan DD-metalloendopeptidase family protein [Deltaproteobacteria bacterium]|nr:peptidoglycan DD-metalloendopeptidase family protein [Deltaproteobacteria bacterium]